MNQRQVEWILAAVSAVGLCLAGCWGPQSPAPPVSPAATGGGQAAQPAAPAARPPNEWTANEILEALLARYRAARSYQDQAFIRVAWRRGGQPAADEQPIAVAFERPGKLSLAAYQATVKCDGKQLRARIEDQETQNVGGQVVVRPAPVAVAIKDLAADRILYNTICGRLRRQPIQLELLLESSGLVSAFSADVACRRLTDERHAGRTCFRVEVPSPGGPFVFWVDQEDGLLRRLDYPAAALEPELASDPEVSELQVLADLRGATLNGPVPPAQFAFDIPAGSKRVKTFVEPPPPLPTNLYGKIPPPFAFTGADGRPISSADLAGRIAVLVWYRDDPIFQATLQQVALASQRLKDDPAVRYLAVATDSAEVPSSVLMQKLAEWHAELPLARDLEAYGDKSFKIQVQPTIVVLDEKLRVQVFEPRGNPQLADQLFNIVQRLKRGDDVAGELLTRRAAEQQRYEQQIAKGGGELEQIVELPEAVIRKRSEPKHLRLSRLWTCTELKSPGNILLVEQPGQPPRMFVFEGGRGIAEVDAGGKIVSRHALELPKAAAVAWGRVATTKEGRCYVLSAPLAPQFFVFDEVWQLKLAYPPADRTPLAILDLAVADVGEADGVPDVIAASVGGQGLVAAGLDGQTKWQNRVLPNVVSVAVSQPDEATGNWALYIAGEGPAGESGSLVRINRFGRDEPPIAVGRRSLLTLTAARFAGAKQAVFLGLAAEASGQRLAIGVTADFKEAWNYPLPAGIHARPIEAIASSHLLPGRQGEWWLAGPDGSIHVISEEGEFFDSLYYGEVLTGIAATKLGERAALLVATDAGLAAWSIDVDSPAAGGPSSPEPLRPKRGSER